MVYGVTGWVVEGVGVGALPSLGRGQGLLLEGWGESPVIPTGVRSSLRDWGCSVLERSLLNKGWQQCLLALVGGNGSCIPVPMEFSALGPKWPNQTGDSSGTGAQGPSGVGRTCWRLGGPNAGLPVLRHAACVLASFKE